MARIQPIDIEKAQGEAEAFVRSVQSKFGKVPNFFATIAHSPEIATAFAAFNGALAKTALTAAEREAIALAQAGYHGCPYCAAAHTAIAGGAGVDDGEIQENLAGRSRNATTQSLIDFATRVVDQRGQVSDANIQAVKAAGYEDGHIVEAIAVISANMFTNLINIVSKTDVDFPAVALPKQKQAA